MNFSSTFLLLVPEINFFYYHFNTLFVSLLLRNVKQLTSPFGFCGHFLSFTESALEFWTIGTFHIPEVHLLLLNYSHKIRVR